MKNGEPPKKTGAPSGKTSGSTGRMTGSASKTTASPSDKSESKKRFGIKAKTPPPAPRQPRARQRLSVTVLGAPNAERPLFEDPLLTALEAGPEHSVSGSATSVLEVPVDLTWPPPAAGDTASSDGSLLHLNWPAPTPPDTASSNEAKAAPKWPATTPDDATAILEAQLDLSWPSPAPTPKPERQRTGTTEALPDRDVWPDVQQLDIPFELRVTPPTQTAVPPRLKIPIDLGATSPVDAPVVEPSHIEIPVDLSPTPPLPTLETTRPARRNRTNTTGTPAPPAATPAPVEVAVVAPVRPNPAPPRKSATTQSSSPVGDAAPVTPVDIAAPTPAATPLRERPAGPRRAATVPAQPPAPEATEPVSLTVSEIAPKASSAAPANHSITSPPEAPTPPRLAAHPKRTTLTPAPATTPAPETPVDVAQASPVSSPRQRPARRPKAPGQPATPEVEAQPTEITPVTAATPAAETPAAVAPALPAPAPVRRPAPARRSRPRAAQTQAPVPPSIERAGESTAAPAAPQPRPTRRKPEATQPAPPPATPVALPELTVTQRTPTTAPPLAATQPEPVAIQAAAPAAPPVAPGETTNPIDAPGWPSFGEFSSPGATDGAASPQAESEQAPAVDADGFRPYRAVYERDVLHTSDADSARPTAEQLDREAAWERAAAETDTPAGSPTTDPAVDTLAARVAHAIDAGTGEAAERTAPIVLADDADHTGEITADEPVPVEIAASANLDEQTLSDHDGLEVRLDAAERELRRLERRTNRKNGDLRNARRREIAEAVRHVLDDGELTPHFDLLLGNGRFEFHRRGPGLSNTSGPMRLVADTTNPVAGPGPQIRQERVVH